MKPARSIVVLLLIVFGTWLVAPGQADEKDKEKKPNQLMKLKLVHSQKILEGMALNNFKQIETSARALEAISKEAGFKAVKTPWYEAFSNQFQQLTIEMADHAKKKNLDGVSLDYVNLTLTCVGCHKKVRDSAETSFIPERIHDPLP